MRTAQTLARVGPTQTLGPPTAQTQTRRPTPQTQPPQTLRATCGGSRKPRSWTVSSKTARR